MNNRNIAIIAAALLLIIAVPLITVLRVTGSHVKTEPAEVIAPEPNETFETVVPILIGFFSDDHHRRSADTDDPKFSPIGYPSVNYDASIAAMKSHVETRGLTYFSPADLPADAFTEEVRQQAMRVNSAMVRSGYDYARSGDKSCEACSEWVLPPFFEGGKTADGAPAPATLIVFGVEAASPVNNGLRSVLGAYLFGPDGRYRNHTFVEYNFTKYATEDFAEDLGEIANKLLPHR